MNLLAIDSSTKSNGIAIYDGLRVRYECTWERLTYHSEDLAPALQEALNRASMKIGELGAVAIAIGPGSYNGLRSGLALAKGLAFAKGIDLIAVPTLDILAEGQPLQDLPMAAVLQAGRGRLAVGWYKVKKGKWVGEGKTRLMNLEELTDAIHQPTIICGELDEDARRALGRKYKNAVLASAAWSLRRPGILAESAWERWQDGKVDSPAGLAPIYLQAIEAVPA